MRRNTLPYLLPIRSVVFVLVFVIGAAVTGKAVNSISNWWSIVATAAQILATSTIPGFYETMCGIGN